MKQLPPIFLRLAPLLSLLLTANVSAHGIQPHDEPDGAAVPRSLQELARAWEFDPGVVTPLLVSGLLYGAGVYRMWASAGAGHGIRKREVVCFVLGWCSLVVALVSPLHRWGDALFWVHMCQHEILMLIGAPLLVLVRPIHAFLKALPPAWAASLARASNVAAWRRAWAVMTAPPVAWAFHAVVLWIWHLPVLFNAALHDDFIHALQHLSFLLSAVLFWWAVLHRHPRGSGYGAAILFMFTTAMHSGLLGAMLTFASRIWYDAYETTTHHWGLTPIEDQQLGGLIMWVPACSVYLAVALILLAHWMRQASDRPAPWEAAIATGAVHPTTRALP